jgi:hypothetical protein
VRVTTEVVDDPQAGLKRALASAIAHSNIQRQRGRSGKSVATISKQKKPKKPKAKTKKLKRNLELNAAEQAEVNRVVSAEAQQHGLYAPVDFKLQEVTEGGRRKEKTMRVVMNRGGTTVERWYRRGGIDDRQMAGIMVYQGAFRTWIGEPRVVANWNAVIVRRAVAALEMHANTRIRARQTLRLFDQEIFFRRGLDDFNVWQNVVIHDESAGVAGSRLGLTNKARAEAVAQFIVASVAHEIAALVIDRQPPDLQRLILDIDAPRKPRT